MSQLTQRILRPDLSTEIQPPIVLLHGWGLNSGVFDTLAEQLSQHMSVILMDLPGFGDNSDIPLGTMSETSELISEHLPEQCHLLGWSLGGLIAQQIALSHPHKLTSLLCIATSCRFMAKSDWPGIKPEVLSLFETQLAHDYRTTVQRFLAIQAMGAPNAKADIVALKQSIARYPEPCEASLLQGLKLLQSTDLSKQIGAINVPTLRLYGRLDALVPVDAATRIASLQPTAKTVIMEHVSHAPFMSAREAFVDEIISFVSP